SLLQWFQRANLIKRQCPEYSQGEWEPLSVSNPAALGIRYRTRQGTMLVLHNLGSEEARVRVKDTGLVDVFANRDNPSATSTHRLDGHGYRWLRAG
ncbi:MAG: maltose alpha-D-glucosyltransferase / alpha-amylase, partial [Gaiellaceae bacterium]|nr:maltose alpha-D-glucosyltransferase / alpha-amylase [Gaiellaceae bacterium]